jgi:hypothetical protein
MVTVYIEEAHAIDEWPMGDGAKGSEFKAIVQPRNIPERAEAAKLLVTELGYEIPLVVDNMENEVRIKYACWPLRFYVIDEEKIWYKAQPSGYRYSVPALRDSILALLESKGQTDSNERPRKQLKQRKVLETKTEL